MANEPKPGDFWRKEYIYPCSINWPRDCEVSNVVGDKVFFILRGGVGNWLGLGSENLEDFKKLYVEYVGHRNDSR